MNKIKNLPTKLDLLLNDETWRVEYQVSLGSPQVLAARDKTLWILTPGADKTKCYALLMSWLREYAQYHLEDFLDELSNKTLLDYNKLQIRCQKTRWGSCSSEKNISLNLGLIFIPRSVVRYVLVHELAHTIHLNHSAKFWKLVDTHEPNFRELKQRLRLSESLIPKWIHR